MKINIPIEQTIKNRSSIRTYDKRKLDIDDKEK